MGNHQSSSSSMSCFQFPMILSKLEERRKTASLFDGKGNLLRRVEVPLRAAELMLEEEPGHVICPAEDLRRTGRFTAAKAEDELVAGESYVLVPLCKLNRRASEADVAALESACLEHKPTSTNKKKKQKNDENRKRTSSRVSPAVAEALKEEEEDFVIRVFDESDDITVGVVDLGFTCRQRGYCRGWRPALETITETSTSRF